MSSKTHTTSLLQEANVKSIESSLQPFNSLPDELLLSVLENLSPLQRCLLLPVCKKWEHTMLLHRSLWNSLTLPPQLSLSASLSALETFNSRSDYQMKHVLIGTQILDSRALEKIFIELEKSADSLRVLILVLEERDLSKKARKLTRTSLPKLNTFHIADAPDDFLGLTSSMWANRSELRITDADEGMKFYLSEYCSGLEREDENWLSGVKSIVMGETDSVKDLHSILKAAQYSLEDLNLYSWFSEDLDDFLLFKQLNLEKIQLKKLEELITPVWSGDEVKMVNEMMELETNKNILLKGQIEPLINFNVTSLQKLHIFILNGETLVKINVSELTPLQKMTNRLFKQNETVQNLFLDCQTSLTSNFNSDLDSLLRLLLLNEEIIKHLLAEPEVNTADPMKISQNSNQPYISRDNFLLPNLNQLTIIKPPQMDKNLLEQLVITRRKINPTLKLSFEDEFGQVLDC